MVSRARARKVIFGSAGNPWKKAATEEAPVVHDKDWGKPSPKAAKKNSKRTAVLASTLLLALSSVPTIAPTAAERPKRRTP